MKSSKVRKMDRKKKAKKVSARKSDIHRKRRLDNKAKRAEIHAIDPDIKVKIIDQVTYDDLGTEIMVENGKIKTVEPEIVVAADEGEVNVIVEAEKGRAIDDQIEKERVGMFDKLIERFKKKDKIPPL
jgi:hypothetical protein